MNPINNLVASPGLAPVGGTGLSVGGGNLQVMMQPGGAFDPNMASTVTLACCQSLCDVLTELPLPTPVVDKSQHTRNLISGGLNGAQRSGQLLNDLNLVPHLQQALYLAKQQLNEINFLHNPTPSVNHNAQANNMVSPSRPETQPSQPPSQLLLALSSQDYFFNSHAPPLYSQSHPMVGGGINNVTNVTNVNLNDLNADLHTIEPSIDRHMSDLHQNLMNDLMNDDCDMSSTINNSGSNDIPSYTHHPPQHPPQPQQHHPNQAHHPHSHSHHHQQTQQQQPQHSQPPPQPHHHQHEQLVPALSTPQQEPATHARGLGTPSAINQTQAHILNSDFGHNNHHNRNTAPVNNILDFDDNYSSLGERVKNRQREAAQKANQANSATFSNMPSSQATSSLQNSNSQVKSELTPFINNNNNVNNNNNNNTTMNNSTSSSSSSSSNTNINNNTNNNHNHRTTKNELNDSKEDKDWQLPGSKKTRNETASSSSLSSTTATVRKQSTSNTHRRINYTDSKPQIRSVKYSFSDVDYSDSMLLNSSVDIVVRFEQIIDEILSTSCNEEEEVQLDESGFPIHQDPKRSKKKRTSKSLDSNHVNGMSFDVSINADQLKEIMILSAKLKQTNRVPEIERKKIILFLTVLSNQLNIWFTRYKSKAIQHNQEEEDYEDAEEREHYWELCCNASQSALHIMTSSSANGDQASLIGLEELIEVIVDFVSNNLSATTHVSISNSNSRTPSKGKAQHSHFGVSKRQVTRWTHLLQLLFEFINLRTKGSLTDTLILSLIRISISGLFLLQNTAEMQFVSIEILCHIFEEYQRHRMSILEELLNSLSKVPTKKSHRKDSVLTQMLVRLTSAFFSPDLSSSAADDNASKANTLHTRESLSKQSTAALQIITGFLTHFLRKCYQHSSNSDVDFKLIFEALLNDLLDNLHSPHSTSSILIVQVIIKLLISFLSPNQSKTQLLAARNLAIEYLSIICSKFAQFFADKEFTVTELEKTLSTIEVIEKPSKRKQKDVNYSQQVMVNKVWNLLVDYFNSEKLYREKLVLASIWVKDKYFAENEQRENQFLQKLNTLKPHAEDDTNSVVDISTAALCIQYMEFVHFSTNSRLFEISISHVTASLSNTTNTTQRSKAMKCLSNILSSSSIERASQLLSRSDLQNAMRSALLDPSTSVREATVDLIGRFVLQSKDQSLCQRYCDLIGERILDTGISVRKRVIKILRDFCVEFPEFEKCGEIAARIVRRINDDGEGIRRLVVEVCRDLWFTNTNSSTIKYRVLSLLHVISTMLNDNTNMDSMQSLFDQLIKSDTMTVAEQICDCIMSDILIDDMPQSKKMTQLSAIQCAAMMSQCCPSLMVKHCDTLQSFLSLSCETLIEISLRMKVIQTIERVLPHVNNPSPQLLTRIEEDLTKNILQSSANIIQCSVKCLAVLVKNHTKNHKLVVDLYLKFHQLLFQCQAQYADGGKVKDEQLKPKLLRAIFTCGLFAKHFPADIVEYKDKLRVTYIQLIESPYGIDIKCKAIIALGFVIESDPKICLLENVVDIYTRILKNQFCPDDTVQARKCNEMYCIQVLNNFRNYLSESIESDENAVKTIEWSRESLKSMQSSEDDSCSAQSQIIQKYLSSILINALNPNLAIRRVACNVIHVIHSGGHVHPLQLVPHLVAMTCDDDYQIRIRADHVLHEIERKYHGFVAMKAKEAVTMSAIFCKRLKTNGYRIYFEKNSTPSGEGPNSSVTVSTNKEICARLSTLYQVICTNRQSRRGFITSLLRHLDTSEMMVKHNPTEEISHSLSHGPQLIDLEFAVENILFFPYTVCDEIMYILNQLECTSSINSTHITQLFKEIIVVDKSTSEPLATTQQQFMPPQEQTPYIQQQQPGYPPHYGNSGYLPQNMPYPAQANMAYPQMMPNCHPVNSHEPHVEDLEDIDLDNEEHKRKFENHIHVNFDLLLSDTRNERLNNLVRSLRTIYLSTLLRTLLKEFYLLKDDKINDYSANDSKTWEKPVHRRQIESAHLDELFSFAKPCIEYPESLLLSEDLSAIERQLLDEWKRFRYVSLNNCDPNFKPSMLYKLFQVKTQQTQEADRKVGNKQNHDGETEQQQISNQLEESIPRTRHERRGTTNDEVTNVNTTNAYAESSPIKKSKAQSKKVKPKKKRKRIIADDSDSNSFSEDDNDDDYDYQG